MASIMICLDLLIKLGHPRIRGICFWVIMSIEENRVLNHCVYCWLIRLNTLILCFCLEEIMNAKILLKSTDFGMSVREGLTQNFGKHLLIYLIIYQLQQLLVVGCSVCMEGLVLTLKTQIKFYDYKGHLKCQSLVFFATFFGLIQPQIVLLMYLTLFQRNGVKMKEEFRMFLGKKLSRNSFKNKS
jgi:hypothetical protein